MYSFLLPAVIKALPEVFAPSLILSEVFAKAFPEVFAAVTSLRCCTTISLRRYYEVSTIRHHGSIQSCDRHLRYRVIHEVDETNAFTQSSVSVHHCAHAL